MSELLPHVLQRDELALLDAPARRLELRRILQEHDAVAALPRLVDRIEGVGALGPLMRDPAITDILVNSHDEIWVERDGALERVEIRFDDPEDLLAFVERTLGSVGRRADAGHPIEDARLPDGSRLHVVMPPLAGDEPVVSIRRFPAVAWDFDELVGMGAMSREVARDLKGLVEERATILVCGQTGCGKTTLVNALLSSVLSRERVVSIEETRELVRGEGHHVALVARPPNADGSGAVGPDDLLRAALRMRPDRIVIGEVRGPEAAVAVEAFSTGHRGGMLTIHAEDASGALDRLGRLAAGPAATSDRRSLAGEAIDVVVVMHRDAGRRKVREVVRT